jgi:DNA-binding MarR family transcriptional regulator
MAHSRGRPDLREIGAELFGTIGPEWMILSVLASEGQGAEMPIAAVSEAIDVDPSFFEMHSNRFEKQGFLRRRPTGGDRQVVMISLTTVAHVRLIELLSRGEL